MKLRLLARDGDRAVPTVGGLLLFCEDCVELFPQAIVKCARFRGVEPTEFLDQKEVRTPLLYQVEETLKFARTHIPRGAKMRGAYREETPAVPEFAVRDWGSVGCSWCRGEWHARGYPAAIGAFPSHYA